MANNKGSVKTKTNSSQWFKNISKSLGYTSMEMISEMVPSSSEFVTSSSESVKDLYKDIKSMRTGNKRISDDLKSIPQVEIGMNALKNAISDIKTGKIYNKDRQEALYNEGMEDFNMEDFQFDDNSDSSSSGSPKPNITINKIGGELSKNSPMVKAIDRQTETIAKTAQATAEMNVNLTSSQMLLNRKTGGAVLKGMESINNNLGLLVRFQGDNMTKYIDASIGFYDQSLKALNTAVEVMQKNNATNTQQTSSSSSSSNPNEDAFLSGGGLNIKGYTNMVKKNFGKALDNNLLTASIKMMLQDKDSLKFLAASPLAFISTKLVSVMMPAILKKTLEDVDKSFANFFPALLMKFTTSMSTSNNPLMQFIGEVFGLNTRTKTSVDLSKYNKGQIPFDGYTKKAITEVIPGYLRKILAAVTGKEEMGFDYDKGVFNSVFEMSKNFKKEQKNALLNGFSEVFEEVKSRSNAFEFRNKDDRKAFMEDMEQFFVNMGKKGEFVNFKDKDKMRDVHSFNSGPEMQRLFQQLILSLPKNMQMNAVGNGVLKSRQALKKMMEEAEENPLKLNAAIINNGLGFDEHIKRDRVNDKKYQAKKGSGLAGITDKYNLSSLDYLRDIKTTLLNGIIVYPHSGNMNAGTGEGELPDGVKKINAYKEKMKAQKDKYTKDNYKYNDAVQKWTTSQQGQIRSEGKTIVETPLDFANKSDTDIRDKIDMYMETQANAKKQNQKDGIGTWLGKFFKGNSQDRYNLLREKIDNIFATPVKLLSSVFKKIDNSMYSIVFGSGEDGKQSFFMKTLSGLKDQFKAMGDWVQNKVLTPLKESLFGKEGIISKIKESDTYKNMKGQMHKLGGYLFGKNGKDGKKQGGLFSDTANEVLDMWDGAKYYFTGKGYTNRAGKSFAQNEKSVFGEMKSMFSGFRDNMKKYLFGDKKAEDFDQQRGVFSGIIDGLKSGFNNFSQAIFGPKKLGGNKNQYSITFDQLKTKIKERAPKALAWGLTGGGAGLLMGGNIGLLGSLFLPGGPVGGMIVGTTLGFLSQSNRFKDWLFGPKDDKGERIGGFMSKSTVSFLKKNRAGIVGGAALGGLRATLGFGFLPSFFLPGGPVGGAIMGMASSMLYRSEAVQKFLFGEKDLDGKRYGGIFQKLFNKGKEHKNLLGNVGAGILGGSTLGLVTSKFGLMGAMLVPGGPIGGAILGAAAGIALTSDRWKKAIFGEWDEKSGLRKGGLLGKFTNWFKLEVQEPLKLKISEISLNIKEWFTKSVANPFKDALEPIRTEFKHMIDSMKDMFKQGWDSFKSFLGNTFEKYVGLPFGKFMEDKVMKPLRGFFSKIINGAGKIVGGVLSAPFKGMNYMAQGLRKKQAQRGLESYIEDEWQDILDFKGRRKRGEKLGFFSKRDANGNVTSKGGFRRVADMYFNKNVRDDARFGEKGASYAREEDIRIKARNDKQDAYFAEQRAKIQSKRDNLKGFRDKGMSHDYENFNEKGENVSDVYNLGRKPVESKWDEAPRVKRASDENLSWSPTKKGAKNTSDNNSGNAQPEAGATPEVKNKKVTPTDNTNINKTTKSAESPTTKPSAQQSNQNSDESDDKGSSTSKSPKIKGRKSYGSGESTNSLLTQIASNVKIIAQEVKGQLDGVGSNVFKMRKLIQKQQGVSDDDLSGNANRDRIGIFGRIKRALYSPIDSIKEFVGKGVNFVTEKIRKVGNVITSVTKSIISIPKVIGKAVANFAIQLGGVARDAFLEIAKLPGLLFKMVGTVLQIGLEALKGVGPAIAESLKGVAKLFSGTMSMVANTLRGVGEGARHLLVGFGKGFGDIIGTVGSGAAKMLTTIGTTTVKAFGMATDFVLKMGEKTADFVFGSFKMITNFTLNTVKFVGQQFADAGKAVFQLFTSPLKFLGNALGKLTGMTQDVFIKGGTIDVVKQLGGDAVADSLSKGLMSGENPKNLVSMLRESPLRVIISGTEKGSSMDVHITDSSAKIQTILDPTSINTTFSKLHTPIPVSMRSDKTTGNVTPFVKVADPTTSKLDDIGDVAENLPSNKISRAMLSALTMQHNKDSKEKKTETKQQALVAKLDADKKFVTRKTADYVIGQKALASKEKFTHDSTVQSLEYLKAIAGATVGHRGDWSDIFGKKGLLFLAAMAALPLIKKLLDWLMGFGNPSRLDANGKTITNSDLMEHLTRGGAKTAAEILEKIAPKLAKKAETITSIVTGDLKKLLHGKTVGKVRQFFHKMPKRVSTATDKVKDHINKLRGIPVDEEILEETVPKLSRKEIKDKMTQSKGYTQSSPFYKQDFEDQFINGQEEKSAKPLYKESATVLEDPKPSFPGSPKEGKVPNAPNINASSVETNVEKSNVFKKTIEKIKNRVQIGKDTVKTVDKTVPHVAVDASLDSTNEKTVNKFIDAANQAVEKIVKMFEEKLPGTSKAISTIKSTLSKVLKHDIIVKRIPQIVKGFGSMAGSVLTFGLKDEVWAVWGVSTGLFESAHLFKVDSDQTDWVMDIISAGMKALMNVSWFFIIGILNDICVEVTGIDFIQMAATSIYKSWASTEKGVKLEDAQAKFLKEKDEYNKKNGTTLSLDAYNDKQNTTVGQKIYNGYQWTKDKVGKGLSATGNWIGNNAKWLGGKISDGANAAGGWIRNNATWLDNTISDGANAAGNWIGNNAKWLWNQSPMGNIYNGYNNDDQLKKNFNISGNGTITGGMRLASGLGQGASALTGGMLDTEDATKSIYAMGVNVNKHYSDMKDSIGKELETIKKDASTTWTNITTSVSKGWNSAMDSINKELTNIENDATKLWNDITANVSKGWNSAYTAINNELDNISKNASELWKKITDNASKAWTNLKDSAIGKELTNIYNDAVKGWGGITKSISDGWSGMSKYLGDTVTSIQKDLTDAWDNTIMPSLRSAWDDIGKFFDNAADRFTTWLKKKTKSSSNSNTTNERLESLGFITTYTADQGGEGGFGNLPYDNGKKAKNKVINGGLGVEPDSVNNFPYFAQTDDRWSQSEYDHSPQMGTHSDHPTIGYRGCGPTSMAMVLTGLTGTQHTPPEMAQIAQSAGYSSNAGTSWSYFDDIASRFNLRESVIPDPRSETGTIQDLVSKNIPVILSGTRTTYSKDESPFTTSGHFVVAVGNSGPDGLIINDPRGSSYSKVYDINKVMNEASSGWAFTYDGHGMSAAVPAASSSGSKDNKAAAAKAAASPKNYTMLDLFGKMGENFTQYVDNVYQGTTTKMTWEEEKQAAAAAAKASSAKPAVASSSSGNKGYVGYADSPGFYNAYSARQEPLSNFKPISVQQLNDWIASQATPGSPFIGNGQVFYDAAVETGLDPRYLVAHAAIESGWGTSQISQDKNNYFGIGAFNATPYQSAYSFDSGLAAGIIGGAKWIKQNYFDAGQDTVDSFIYGNPGHVYAQYDDGSPNEEWAANIGSIMSTAPQDGGGNGEMQSSVLNILGKNTNLRAAMGGGFGELPTDDGVAVQSGLNLPLYTSTSQSPEVQQALFEYKNGKTDSDELLNKIIDVLNDINHNTDGVNKGIKKMRSGSLRVNIDGKPSSSDKSVLNNVSLQSSPDNSSFNPSMSAMDDRRNNSVKRDYETAKSIARGRIK